MWTWPLDSALGATAAHRAPERMADGTQVEAWMTNKGRRRMNERGGYITSEISQVKKEGGGEKSPGKREELGIHILGRRVLSPWDVGPSDPMFLAPIWSSPIPKQVITSSELNFWTHSLQIYCNRSTGPRSRPSLGPVRNSWPYTYNDELYPLTPTLQSLIGLRICTSWSSINRLDFKNYGDHAPLENS